eukprot:4340369-Prymnesium_polylepis.1
MRRIPERLLEEASVPQHEGRQPAVEAGLPYAAPSEVLARLRVRQGLDRRALIVRPRSVREAEHELAKPTLECVVDEAERSKEEQLFAVLACVHGAVYRLRGAAHQRMAIP